MTPGQVSSLKQQVENALTEVHQLGERHVFREQTDFIGRMAQAASEIDEVDEGAPEGVYSDQEREMLDEALLEMASLCLGRLVLLRAGAKATTS